MERLRKAVKHAAELAVFGDALGDARTKLETQAYHAWMDGTLSFEMEQWENALQSFNRAKTIYNRLAEAFSEEIKTVYVQKVITVVSYIYRLLILLAQGFVQLHPLLFLLGFAGSSKSLF